MKALIAVGLFLGFALFIARSAHGQDLCCERDDPLRHSEKTYSETVTGRGPTSSGRVYELLLAPDGKT